MTRILHTADLHLKEHGDERWEALLKLIRLGREKEADLLAISGDLFDKNTHGEVLRDKIRGVFRETGFPVAIIPGNHDSASFSRGLFFGEEAHVLSDPRVPLQVKDSLIWGFPFEDLEEGEVINRLQGFSGRLSSGCYHVLLYHGELLDAFFGRKELGEEGDRRYMPARLSYFKEAGFDYVLAGHFHTKFNLWALPENRGFFVYPGSPVSITSRETGPRKANLLETGGPPREHLLDTLHYENIRIDVDPFENRDPVQMVKERLENLPPAARAFIRVTGYINGASVESSEKELAERLSALAKARGATVSFDLKDVQAVLEDPLARNFMSRLEQEEMDRQLKKQVREMALRAMLEAK